ncbi:MAG: cold-shock protein [Arenicella sp.]
MPKGHLKSWRRDRGFGFINVEGRDTDVFVHISELRALGRPPRVGDEISFDIETQDNGKVRAINCSVKGSSKDSQNHPSHNNSNQGSKTTLIAVAVIAIVIIGLYLYLK